MGFELVTDAAVGQEGSQSERYCNSEQRVEGLIELRRGVIWSPGGERWMSLNTSGHAGAEHRAHKKWWPWL